MNKGQGYTISIYHHTQRDWVYMNSQKFMEKAKDAYSIVTMTH